MKPLYWLPVLLVVASNIIYHLSQKTTPSSANPIVAIGVSYLVALSLTGVGLIFFFPKEGLKASLGMLNISSISLGIAIFGVEMGFLWAYRLKWKMGLAALYSNSLVALLLIPIALVYFNEGLSRMNTVGIALAIIGLVLMSV